MRTYQNTVAFNKQLISNYFGGTRQEYSSIAYKALKNLTDNGILKLNKDIDFKKPKPEDWIIADVNFPPQFKEHYFSVFNYHLKKIMDYPGEARKHKLLTLFCAIRYRIYGNQACDVSIKTLSHETGIDKGTIKKYVDILSNLGLIIYDNPGIMVLSNEDIKHSPNFYVLAVDGAENILKINIEEYRKRQISKGVRFINNEETKKIMNQRRINTCKKNRADYMLSHGQLEEDKYLEINTAYEKRKEELQNIPQYVQDYIDELEGNEVVRTPEEIQKSIDDWNEIANVIVLDVKPEISKSDNPFDGVEEVVDDFDDETIIDEINEVESIKEPPIESIVNEPTKLEKDTAEFFHISIKVFHKYSIDKQNEEIAKYQRFLNIEACRKPNNVTWDTPLPF